MPASCKAAGPGVDGTGGPALRFSWPWARRCLRFLKFGSYPAGLSRLGCAQRIQLVGQGITLLVAGTRGNGATMEHGAAGDAQAAGARHDNHFGLFLIIIVDGLAAPVRPPFQVRVIERRDVPLVRRAVAMHEIAVAIDAAIDIDTLVRESLVRKCLFDQKA